MIEVNVGHHTGKFSEVGLNALIAGLNQRMTVGESINGPVQLHSLAECKTVVVGHPAFDAVGHEIAQ